MASKQIWVSVKECRLIEQWLNTTIASVKWKDLIDFFWKDMKVLAKAADWIEESQLYREVGKDIENKAHEIVETKCRPEWTRISDEMRPIGDKRNELAKKKASKEEGSVWSEEEEKELVDLDKQLSDLSEQYQKVTDDANAELNAYKDVRISEEQGACFFLSEKDYKTVGWYVWF